MRVVLFISIFIFMLLFVNRLVSDIINYKEKYTYLENDIKYSKAITIDNWVYRCNKVLSNVGSEPLRKE